jgi:hypothetical protein
VPRSRTRNKRIRYDNDYEEGHGWGGVAISLDLVRLVYHGGHGVAAGIGIVYSNYERLKSTCGRERQYGWRLNSLSANHQCISWTFRFTRFQYLCTTVFFYMYLTNQA